MTDEQSFEVNARFEYGAYLTPNVKCKDINIEELKFQLKRKEQECEKKDKDIKYLTKCLDNSFKTQQDSELHWEREKKKLKVENEKFKKFVAHNLFNINCDNWLDRFIDYFEKWKHELVAENEKLKQTLTEIKDYCNKYPQNSIGFKKYIIQKISECEVENE